MARYFIHPNITEGHINREIQGHFSEHLGRCIYEGLYVGEDSEIPNENGIRKDVVEALKKIALPVLRWPGGCFADEYHWKDGIGSKEQRKKMINTHWGGVVEDNSFGTHEFMELCRQLGCRPYIAGNMGSGTVQEMSEWIEYMTFDGVSPLASRRAENGQENGWQLDYFGIGNENWGCGGCMTPEYYANEYRRYQTYVRQYNKDRKIKKIACGPNVDDYRWTETVMRIAGKFMDGLSLHYYTVPGDWTKNRRACDFGEEEWYCTLRKTLYMDTLLKRHGAIMDRYDPERRVGLIVDEWGTWYDVEEGTNSGFLYQQNTMRDALVAAINLNLFNKHCCRVKMANIAQLANVLQALVLTEAGKMILTPTYHVFDLFQCHQDAELVHSFLETEKIGMGENIVPNLVESVSRKGNQLNITVCNLSASEDYSVEGVLTGYSVKNASARILKGAMDAHNTFDNPHNVVTEDFEAVTVKNNEIEFPIPACSVLRISLEI